MISHHKSQIPSTRAFSLVELLAAMAVLSILGIIIAQITSATGNTTRLSNRAVDAGSQARLAFDRIGMDLGALIHRSDTSFIATNPAAPSGDLLVFLSAVTSPGLSATTNRNLSLVAYRIAPHPDNQNRPCLLRASKALDWNNSDFMGNQNNNLPIGFASWVPTPAEYDVLTPGILRVVIGFQLYPDNQQVVLMDGTIIPQALGQIVYSPPTRSAHAPGNTHIDLQRIASLVIGLVSLDLDSAKLLDASQASSLHSHFPLPSTGQMPVELWSPAIDALAIHPGSLPRRACQALRVYQRFYPITPYGTGPSI